MLGTVIERLDKTESKLNSMERQLRLRVGVDLINYSQNSAGVA